MGEGEGTRPFFKGAGWEAKGTDTGGGGGGRARGKHRVHEGGATTLYVEKSEPLPRSHTLAVLSSPPVASCRPSGLKATLLTPLVCPCVAARA